MPQNKFYADLNVIYAFFDYMTPNSLNISEKEIKNRRNSILNFIASNNPKLIISRTVFIEWFQANVDSIMSDEGKSFNAATKTSAYKDMLNKFRKTAERIEHKDSIFEFEWESIDSVIPVKQTWDYFHELMKEKDYKFVSFDKKFTKNKFILLKQT